MSRNLARRQLIAAIAKHGYLDIHYADRIIRIISLRRRNQVLGVFARDLRRALDSLAVTAATTALREDHP